jgi:hypothetical protein
VDSSFPKDEVSMKRGQLQTTKVIEILCPNDPNDPNDVNIHTINEIDQPGLMFTLEVQKTIGQGDTTTVLNGNGGLLTTAELKACVD